MLIYKIVVWAWVLDIILLAWLARIFRHKQRQLFRAFILFDLVRSALAFAVWLTLPRWCYGWAFMITEAPDVLLLGAAAIEAGREISDRWHPYVTVAAIFISMLLPGIQPFASPPNYQLGNYLYMVRFVACFSAAVALLITTVWHRRIVPHVAVLVMFCLFDACTYLAILKGVRGLANAFVLVAQCGCVGVWVWLAMIDRRILIPDAHANNTAV